MKRVKVSIFTTGAIVVACAAQAASSAAISSGSSEVVAGSGVHLISATKFDRVLVLSKWTTSGGTIEVIGLPHSEVSAKETGSGGLNKPGTLAVMVNPPAITLSPHSWALDISPTEDRSLMLRELTALGATKAIATSMADSVRITIAPQPRKDDRNSSTVTVRKRDVSAQASPSSTGPLHVTHLDTRTQITTASPMVVEPGTVFNTQCNKQTGDVGDAQGYSCLVQTMAQNNASGHYVDDDITATGSDLTDFWDNLTELEAFDYYTYGGSTGDHSIVKWSPSSTEGVGNPTTVTASVSWDGIGVSTSETVYPASLNPELLFYDDDYYTGFGSQWDGCDGTDEVGAPSADLARVYPGGTFGAGDATVIGWNIC